MRKKIMSKALDPGCFNGFLSVVPKKRRITEQMMKEHVGGVDLNEVRFLNREEKQGWFLSDLLNTLGRRLPCSSGNRAPSSSPEKSISAVAGKVSLSASTTSTSCSTPCGPSESGPSSSPLASKPSTSTPAAALASINDTPSSTSSPAAALASPRIVSEDTRQPCAQILGPVSAAARSRSIPLAPSRGSQLSNSMDRHALEEQQWISSSGSGSESATTRRTEYSSDEVAQPCFFSMNDSEMASPNQRSFGPRDKESSSSFSDEDSERRKPPAAKDRCSIVDLYNANWGEKHTALERITGHRSLITRSGEDMSSTMTMTTKVPLGGGIVNILTSPPPPQEAIKKDAKMPALYYTMGLGPDDFPSTNPHDPHHQTIKSESSNPEKSISQSGNKDDAIIIGGFFTSPDLHPSPNSSILGSSGGDHYFQPFSSTLTPSSRTSGGSRATVSHDVIHHRGVSCKASSSSSSFPSDKKPGGRRASSAPSRISTCSSHASTGTRMQSEGTTGVSNLSHHHHHHQGEEAFINERKNNTNTTVENLSLGKVIGIMPGRKSNWSPCCHYCEKVVRKIRETEREARKKEQQIAACLEDFQKQEPSANKRVLGQFRVLLNYWKMQDDVQRNRSKEDCVSTEELIYQNSPL